MMHRAIPALFLALATIAAVPAAAQGSGDDPELPAYLQCVPYARAISGIAIYGDAYTWWGQAQGRYATGHTPRVGAVMAFAPYQGMQLGHVAAVSRVIDSRTVLIDHANWSPIDGRRGQIERDVRAVDVSPDNDWSEVRVWYAPIDALGTTAWPVEGFIYGDGAMTRAAMERRAAAAAVEMRGADTGAAGTDYASAVVGDAPSRDFAQAFDRMDAARTVAAAPSPARTPGGLTVLSSRYAPVAQAQRRSHTKPIPAPSQDPYAAVIARYN